MPFMLGMPIWADAGAAANRTPVIPTIASETILIMLRTPSFGQSPERFH
jgi:hypothetical protein